MGLEFPAMDFESLTGYMTAVCLRGAFLRLPLGLVSKGHQQENGQFWGTLPF